MLFFSWTDGSDDVKYCCILMWQPRMPGTSTWRARHAQAEKQHDTIRIGSANKNPARKGSLRGAQSQSLRTAWARMQSHKQWAGVRAQFTGEKEKAFVQPGIQTEQTEHQDQARTVLSSQRLSAKEKATRAHLLTHTHLLRRGRSITGHQG